MHLHRRSRLAALALGAAAALLLPTAAMATSPLVTDPAGDANMGDGLCIYAQLAPCPASSPTLSEAAIDVLEGDIVQSGTDLLFRIEVSDIDAPPLQDTTRYYSFDTSYAGKDVTLLVSNLSQHASAATGMISFREPLSPTGPHRAVAVTLDHATNVVELTVPLSVANEALAEMCPTCAPLGTGSTLQDFAISAGYQVNVANIVRTSCQLRCDVAGATGTFTLA